jgi:hypothetical protein
MVGVGSVFRATFESRKMRKSEAQGAENVRIEIRVYCVTHRYRSERKQSLIFEGQVKSNTNQNVCLCKTRIPPGIFLKPSR